MVFIFLLQLFQLQASEVLPKGKSMAPLSLWQSPVLLYFLSFFFFLNTFLPAGTIRYSRLMLCFLCPKCRLSHFSKEPWFLLLKNGIRNQGLGTGMLVAIVVSLLLGCLKDGARKLLSMLTRTSIHIYNGFCVCLSVCIKLRANAGWCLTNQAPDSSCPPFSLLACNDSLWQ